jgi:hypothetical protein
MDFALAQVLRRGVIPWCCGGASACFAFYAVQVTRAANEWKALAIEESRGDAALKISSGKDSAASVQKEFALYQAQALVEHAGTGVALSLTSFSIAVEAMRDWKSYRRLRTLDDMEQWMLYGKGKRTSSMRRLFFFRNSVLVTAILSFGVVEYSLGRVRLFYWP